MNTMKTTLFLAALTVLFVWVGGSIGGSQGAWMAFLFACIMNFSAYWFSDKFVLALYQAKPLSSNEAPEIHGMIQDLASSAGLPMPRIYRIPSKTPNAFATGRNPQNAVVAVTDGILEILSPEELRGVLAHEMAHVAHRDILISTIAATLAGAVTLLADIARWSFIFGGGRHTDEDSPNPAAAFISLLLAPIAALLIQLAVSRSREYEADLKGGKLCRNPLYLARALEKLEKGVSRNPMQAGSPATAHLFIVNPFRGGGMMTLFSTHPPIKERIHRLEQLALDMRV